MTHTFPEDLVQTQRDWYAVYRRLAEEPRHSASETAVLRRRLLRLSVRVSTHPYWQTAGGRRPAARMALKEAAWAEASAEVRAESGRGG
ncbi:hypothetical protein [Streptomyces synnematoformans]|uniref:Uncharacterized protein n=1 Tax=Streptomyces synnematoformans TaxID=415721 RepID=A0ABN1ZNZ6_9ACTN